MQETATLPELVLIQAHETETSFPAIILCNDETAALRVVGLPLLDRLIVAAHRAGAADIRVVSAQPLPQLPRSSALEPWMNRGKK